MSPLGIKGPCALQRIGCSAVDDCARLEGCLLYSLEVLTLRTIYL